MRVGIETEPHGRHHNQQSEESSRGIAYKSIATQSHSLLHLQKIILKMK